MGVVPSIFLALGITKVKLGVRWMLVRFVKFSLGRNLCARGTGETVDIGGTDRGDRRDRGSQGLADRAFVTRTS